MMRCSAESHSIIRYQLRNGPKFVCPQCHSLFGVYFRWTMHRMLLVKVFVVLLFVLRHHQSRLSHHRPQCPYSSLPSTFKPNRQNNQARIRSNTQRGQNHHRIPTRPKFLPPQPIISHLTKELSVPLISSIHAHQQYASPIRRKQRTDTVELCGEDLQHDERERELAECRSDVCALEGSLSCADFGEPAKQC
jgi:hypothetical protein